MKDTASDRQLRYRLLCYAAQRKDSAVAANTEPASVPIADRLLEGPQVRLHGSEEASR